MAQRPRWRRRKNPRRSRPRRSRRPRFRHLPMPLLRRCRGEGENPISRISLGLLEANFFQQYLKNPKTSHSDDSKFVCFFFKWSLGLTRTVTMISRRRFGLMFLQCQWFSGTWPWQILDMESNSTNQTVKATVCWVKPSYFLSDFFRKNWKNGKRCDHHPVHCSASISFRRSDPVAKQLPFLLWHCFWVPRTSPKADMIGREQKNNLAARMLGCQR